MSNILLAIGAAILTALLFVCFMDWVEDLIGGIDRWGHLDDDDEEM